MNKMNLSREDPAFLELEERYKTIQNFPLGVWEPFQRGIDMNNFRGESFYLAQFLYGATPEKYWTQFGYLMDGQPEADEWNWLRIAQEDNAFGCLTLKSENMVISRDLLDSISEIKFIQDSLRFTYGDHVSVLDIGAGYGRFAHRFGTIFENSHIHTTDAVPISSYICGHYLTYRNMDSQTTTWPLFSLGELSKEKVDVAVNIHSFSECTLESINSWLDLVVDMGIHNLFIVPHDERFICCDTDGSNPSFRPAIEKHGFSIRRAVSKYPESLRNLAPFPTTYYMFGRD